MSSNVLFGNVTWKPWLGPKLGWAKPDFWLGLWFIEAWAGAFKPKPAHHPPNAHTPHSLLPPLQPPTAYSTTPRAKTSHQKALFWPISIFFHIFSICFCLFILIRIPHITTCHSLSPKSSTYPHHPPLTWPIQHVSAHLMPTSPPLHTHHPQPMSMAQTTHFDSSFGFFTTHAQFTSTSTTHNPYPGLKQHILTHCLGLKGFCLFFYIFLYPQNMYMHVSGFICVFSLVTLFLCTPRTPYACFRVSFFSFSPFFLPWNTLMHVFFISFYFTSISPPKTHICVFQGLFLFLFSFLFTPITCIHVLWGFFLFFYLFFFPVIPGQAWFRIHFILFYFSVLFLLYISILNQTCNKYNI